MSVVKSQFKTKQTKNPSEIQRGHACLRVVATPKVHDMQCHYYDIMSRVITLHNVTLILLTFFSPGKLLQSTI